MDVRQSSLGALPCLVAGAGPPLVMPTRLAPEAGVSAGPLRRMHESAMGRLGAGREVFYHGMANTIEAEEGHEMN